LDYYHVGIVKQVSPLCIVHCTKSAKTDGITYDDKLGAWKYAAFLNAIQYKEVTEMSIVKGMYTVGNIPEDETVRVRAGPGKNYKTVDKLVYGTEVEVVGESGEWALLTTGGYIMTAYLTEKQKAKTEVTLTLSRETVIALRDACVSALGDE